MVLLRTAHWGNDAFPVANVSHVLPAAGRIESSMFFRLAGNIFPDLTEGSLGTLLTLERLTSLVL
jgi:hypothetical protein